MRNNQIFLLAFLFMFISKSSFANNLELQKLLQCQNDNTGVLDQFLNPKHVVDGEMLEVYRATDSKTKVFGSSIKHIDYLGGESFGVHYTLLNTKSFIQPLRYAENIFKNKRQAQEIEFEEFKQGKQDFESIQRSFNGYVILTENSTISFFKLKGFVAVRCD